MAGGAALPHSAARPNTLRVRMLARQPGALLSKNALLDEVWGHQFVSDSVLKTVISELRTLLDYDARQPWFIETVSRRGYRFIAAPIAVPATSAAQASAAGIPAPPLSEQTITVAPTC